MPDVDLPFRFAAGERVALRKAIDRDLDGLVELRSDPDVRRHLGGAVPEGRVRDLLTARSISWSTEGSGEFVVADAESDDLLGMVVLDRRSATRPGHVRDEGEELELSYVLRRSVWGRGLAREAAGLLLREAAAHLEDQPVLLVSTVDNARSIGLARRLGFEDAGTFTEFDAEQWLGSLRLGRWA
ncbi:GNAT family N-acetyltransferase [Georgenia sp. Z1344]|uniref:GNAT family N-acetyltransferase n=1 Tax=Georgenia sp. Z1344 TaxID=3416706 RepID=UPI003CF24D13